MKKLVMLKIALAALAVAALLSTTPATAQVGTSGVNVYVLDLEATGQPAPQYSVLALSEFGYTLEVAEWRAKEIGVKGILSGRIYYPPHMVQRIHVYTLTVTSPE